MLLQGGHQNLVEFFIKKGVKLSDVALVVAIQNDHLSLVNFFSKKVIISGAVIIAAIASGNIQFVKRFHQDGLISIVDGLMEAIQTVDQPIFEFYAQKCIEMGVRPLEFRWVLLFAKLTHEKFNLLSDFCFKNYQNPKYKLLLEKFLAIADKK